MGTKISEKTKKHILHWDEDKSDLLLYEYKPTTWNILTEQYDIQKVGTYKVGGGDYGNMFDFSSNTVTTISSSSTYYPVQCVTTSVYTKGFTHSNGRLTKVGDGYNPIKLEGVIAFNGTNNDELHVTFHKSGVIIPCSLGTMVIRGSGGNTISFHCMTEMVDGDYIEVYVSNQSGARDVTLENMNIILTELT